MLKKLEELNKRRKEVLKFIDIKKIDFNSKKIIIPIEAVKCNKSDFVDYNLAGMTKNIFFTQRGIYKSNPILFRGEQINRAFINFVNDLQIDIDELCVEYYYFIKDNKLGINKISGILGSISGWTTFFNVTLFTPKRENINLSINKKKIKFLVKINDVLEKIVKGKK